MGKIIFIGKQGAGKTTLIQSLLQHELSYKKTQVAEFYKGIIDTPGEYLENPRFYNAIITLSFDANVVALVHDATSDANYFPPGFGTMFNKPVIGIVTKMDEPLANSCRSRSFLTAAGANHIYEVSAYTNEGMCEILSLLKD